jgi:hypothetical protein
VGIAFREPSSFEALSRSELSESRASWMRALDSRSDRLFRTFPAFTDLGVAREFLALLKLHRVPAFAYELTGSSFASAANSRSSALAVPLRQLSARDSDMGSGKISSSPFSTPSKMARATDSGEAFGTS